MRATEPETIVDSLAIRDTSSHTPATDSEIEYVDIHEWKGFVIKLTNNLDKDVTMTIYGNFARNTIGAKAYTTTLAVTAGASGFIKYHAVRDANWTPWIYPSLVCSVIPTSGDADAEIVKMDKGADW